MPAPPKGVNDFGLSIAFPVGLRRQDEKIIPSQSGRRQNQNNCDDDEKFLDIKFYGFVTCQCAPVLAALALLAS